MGKVGPRTLKEEEDADVEAANGHSSWRVKWNSTQWRVAMPTSAKQAGAFYWGWQEEGQSARLADFSLQKKEYAASTHLLKNNYHSLSNVTSSSPMSWQLSYCKQ